MVCPGAGSCRCARGHQSDATIQRIGNPAPVGNAPTVRERRTLTGTTFSGAAKLVQPARPRPSFEPAESAVSQAEVEAAVRTLIRWAGDDPDREGLVGTPDRVVRAFADYFSGYSVDPVDLLSRTFEEIEGYDEMVLLRDIRVESHCEHHMAPIVGRAHVAYLPRKRVVGISKLVRIVEAYAKRLQIQEKLTAQIANSINDVLQPLGVAVVIEAVHHCMTTRGVHKPGASMVTSRMLGAFRDNASTRREFLDMIGNPTHRLE